MTTTTMTRTELKLADMLQENTGRHFLDSGGAYGRNWERNQGRDFSAEPVVSWDRYGISISVFHWLSERLDYLESADEHWQAFLEPLDEISDLEAMERYAERYGSDDGYLVSQEPLTVNTYNGEDALSQVLQFTLFYAGDESEIPELAGEYGVLLQIHGGCDVRGGYTRPVLFRAIEPESLFDNAQAFLQCQPEDRPANQPNLEGIEPGDPVVHSWYTDNAGYSWYEDGAYSADAPTWEDFVREDPDTLELELTCPNCGSPMVVWAR